MLLVCGDSLQVLFLLQIGVLGEDFVDIRVVPSSLRLTVTRSLIGQSHVQLEVAQVVFRAEGLEALAKV